MGTRCSGSTLFAGFLDRLEGSQLGQHSPVFGTVRGFLGANDGVKRSNLAGYAVKDQHGCVLNDVAITAYARHFTQQIQIPDVCGKSEVRALGERVLVKRHFQFRGNVSWTRMKLADGADDSFVVFRSPFITDVEIIGHVG